MASGCKPKSLCCSEGQTWVSGSEPLQAQGSGKLKWDVKRSSLCVVGQKAVFGWGKYSCNVLEGLVRRCTVKWDLVSSFGSISIGFF